MSTRLYVSSRIGGPLQVAPNGSTDWDVTPSPVPVLRLADHKVANGALTNFSGAETSASVVTVLCAVLVSPFLAAQTISGTFKGQARFSESNAAADMMVHAVVRLVDGDGAHKSYLYNTKPDSLASEFSTSARNARIPESSPGSLTSQDAVDGDMLVVELGAKVFETSATSRTATLSLLDSNGTDLPEDQTTTTANDPWIEFSANLSWLFTGNQNLIVDEWPYDTSVPIVGQTWPR